MKKLLDNLAETKNHSFWIYRDVIKDIVTENREQKFKPKVIL